MLTHHLFNSEYQDRTIYRASAILQFIIQPLQSKINFNLEL